MTIDAMRAAVMSWGTAGFPFALEVVLALILNWLIGGIPFLSPARWLGAIIGAVESALRKRIENKPSLDRVADEKTNGLWLVIITLGLAMLAGWAIPFALSFISGMAASIGRILMIFFTLGSRSLFTSSRKVAKAIQNDDKERARAAVASLTTRDTDKLSVQGVARVACEAVATNTCDVVVGPLFYAIVGYFIFFGFGPSFAWLYMASAVLAARIGKTSSKNINFGYYAQRVACFLFVFPSRLAGLALVGAAFLMGRNGKRSFSLMINENANASDVNSGWTMAPVSGALGIKMGGGAYYSGIWRTAPTIGFDTKAPEATDISAALGLMVIAQGLCVLVGLLMPNIMVLLTVLISIYDMYKKIRRMGGFGGFR